MCIDHSRGSSSHSQSSLGFVRKSLCLKLVALAYNSVVSDEIGVRATSRMALPELFDNLRARKFFTKEMGYGVDGIEARLDVKALAKFVENNNHGERKESKIEHQ